MAARAVLGGAVQRDDVGSVPAKGTTSQINCTLIRNIFFLQNVPLARTTQSWILNLTASNLNLAGFVRWRE